MPADPPLSFTPQQVADMHTISAQNMADLSSAVTEAVVNSIAALAAQLGERDVRDTNTGKIKGVCENVIKCEGISTVETREWLVAMETAVQATAGVPNNVHRIARKTTRGQLYRAIEQRFRITPGVSWAALKAYVSDAFLGTNEQERLRLEMTKQKQGTDGILMFNRKYSALAEMAYGTEPRAPDVEKLLIRHYVLALNDRDIGRKIITESAANTLADALAYADRRAMGEELFLSMTGEEMMDVSTVTVPPPQKKADDSRMDRQATKLAKLEAELRLLKSKSSASQPKQREQKCYECGKVGHFARDCRRGRQRQQWVPPPSRQQRWTPPQPGSQQQQGPPPQSNGRRPFNLN